MRNHRRWIFRELNLAAKQYKHARRKLKVRKALMERARERHNRLLESLKVQP